MRSLPSGLGPHCVGQRVVVRRVLPGQTGPTGGPAMTDLLGVMESWTRESTTLRDASGTLTEIALADIVSGKPVPPRPPVRLRVTSAEAERRALDCWPALVAEPLGEWVLRAAGGYTARANSVLAAGDPGVPFDEAVAAVRRFYSEHRLPARAQVVVDSEEHLRFESEGWVPARPGEADTVFGIASVAQATRAARRLVGPPTHDVVVGTTVGPGWLVDDQPATAHGEDALAVLEGPDQVAFVGLGEPPVAKGRVALSERGTDPWAGISNVWVRPSHRRRGLALRVLVELLGWAGERGATTAFLQTRGDNPGALALYDRLGFAEHHRYRYLALPE